MGFGYLIILVAILGFVGWNGVSSIFKTAAPAGRKPAAKPAKPEEVIPLDDEVENGGARCRALRHAFMPIRIFDLIEVRNRIDV